MTPLSIPVKEELVAYIYVNCPFKIAQGISGKVRATQNIIKQS